jgi:aspartate aminotransferase-like enzyme
MKSESLLRVKIAREDWEIDAIHRLNYKTFAEEIPQHQKSSDRRLVDKFHEENTYVICLEGKRLIGMTALRGKRPFSLDQKLADLNSYLPPGRTLCEIRLLSVEKGFRNGNIFRQLLALVVEHGKALGYDLALISGTIRQEKLYRHLGFTPFGPKVGEEGALFQPMYLPLEIIEEKSTLLFSAARGRTMEQTLASFLPGPVEIAPVVRDAFSALPISHRARSFHSDLERSKNLLKHLTLAGNVEILLGSGTLANAMIAAQLSTLNCPGLILSNGEFGSRLVDHATRLGLAHKAIQLPWGDVFDLDAIRKLLDRSPEIGWIWAVHCETSTGALNDIEGLKQLCTESAINLCLDCISSIGTVPVDLTNVHLASCVSGKGLGAFPGLAMVFYDEPMPPSKTIPRYLDLGYYIAMGGVPFTHSSNLLAALNAALTRVTWTERYLRLNEVSAWLDEQLHSSGFQVIGSGLPKSPAVVTLVLPEQISSRSAGWQLEKAGLLLHYRSSYLLERNWIQICMMGEFSKSRLESLLNALDCLCPASQRQSGPHRLEPGLSP